MKSTVKVGIIGYGTIGMGTAKILVENKDLISKRTGKEIILEKLVDLDITTEREFQIDASLLSTDINDILENDDIDIVVEAIGGTNPAKAFIERALKNKKSVVTPNKEVIAKHGRELMILAEENGVDLFFEAAVGGGIPIIRPLKMGIGANNVKEIYGIVNGTTNFILTKMTDEGGDFGETLKEAQELGYAEADPTADIEGYDSSYKLVILSILAFGAKVDFENIYFEGISSISGRDNMYAKEFGYEIKLLAVGKEIDGNLELRVHPTFVPLTHPLANVKGVNNAIYVKGDYVGETMFYGPGAGAEPTGSAVVADILDIAYSIDAPLNRRNLRTDFDIMNIVDRGEFVSEYFFRVDCADECGVLAAISGILGKHNVSIKSALQKDQTEKGSELVFITHDVKESSILKAMKEIENLDSVFKVYKFIRVGV
ncbi:MAG: homoserine dehydrogenase [Spirochaetaceae bacterium]|nr:homoserine dehydrogenase [Spirochaetaceae bacterium]